MLTSTGFIDALVLQPRPTLTAADLAHIAYLERRIAHARDEFAREVLASVLEEFLSRRVPARPPTAIEMDRFRSPTAIVRR